MVIVFLLSLKIVEVRMRCGDKQPIYFFWYKWRGGLNDVRGCPGMNQCARPSIWAVGISGTQPPWPVLRQRTFGTHSFGIPFITVRSRSDNRRDNYCRCANDAGLLPPSLPLSTGCYLTGPGIKPYYIPLVTTLLTRWLTQPVLKLRSLWLCWPSTAAHNQRCLCWVCWFFLTSTINSDPTHCWQLLVRLFLPRAVPWCSWWAVLVMSHLHSTGDENSFFSENKEIK